MTRAPSRSQRSNEDLKTTPFAHLLIELFDAQRTGSLLIYDPSDALHAAIRIEAGRPTAVLAAESGERRVSDLLMPLCAWPSGRFDFAEEQDLVGSDGLVAAGPIDPVPMITAACRTAMRDDVVAQTMGLISRSLIKLSSGLELRRYGFTPEERLVVRALDQGPMSLDELRAQAEVPDEILQRVLYVLRITRGIALLPLQRSASGTVSHAAPVANRSIPPGMQRSRESSSSMPAQAARSPSQSGMQAVQPGQRPSSQPRMPAVQPSQRPGSQPNVPATQSSQRPSPQPRMPAAQSSQRPGSQSRMPAAQPSQRPGSQPRMPAVQSQIPSAARIQSARPNSRPINENSQAPIASSRPPLRANSERVPSSPVSGAPPDSKRPLPDFEERERRGESEGLWLQAESLSRRAEYDAALRIAQRALKVMTPPPGREALLGWLMYQHAGAGEDVHPHVWTCLNRALKRDPLCEDALYYKGCVLGLSGNAEQAQAHFERVLMLNPKHSEAEREVRIYEMRRASEKNSGFLSRFLSRPPKGE